MVSFRKCLKSSEEEQFRATISCYESVLTFPCFEKSSHGRISGINSIFVFKQVNLKTRKRNAVMRRILELLLKKICVSLFQHVQPMNRLPMMSPSQWRAFSQAATSYPLEDNAILNTARGHYHLLYYYMRNFCNLIGLEQWYFSLI